MIGRSQFRLLTFNQGNEHGMRATVMHGAGDVRVETVPDARIIEPTDALVTVTRACICGSDLWPYNAMKPSEIGNRMGHEFVGLVEAVGAEVRTVRKGDLVVAPFAWSDGTCEFCQHGLQTSCLHGGWWGGTPGSLAVRPQSRYAALTSC
jgi:threonine dehydrogenase-like Zn-dependent dehydrogenase